MVRSSDKGNIDHDARAEKLLNFILVSFSYATLRITGLTPTPKFL
jgi:hypothetical protein